MISPSRKRQKSKPNNKDKNKIINNDNKKQQHKDDDDDTPCATTMKDDMIAVIFSFLHHRDVGRASTTCGKWNQIYNSDAVQTTEFNFDVRWAKYANVDRADYALPRIVSVKPENFLLEPSLKNRMSKPEIVCANNLLASNKCYGIHMLNGGRYILIWKQREDESEWQGFYYFDLMSYSSNTGNAKLLHSFCVENLITSTSNKSNLLVTCARPEGEETVLQLWTVSARLKVKKGKSIVINDDWPTELAMSASGNVFYYTNIAEDQDQREHLIKVWVPSKSSDIETIKDDVNICSGFVCWNDILFFVAADVIIDGVYKRYALEAWCTVNHKRLTGFLGETSLTRDCFVGTTTFCIEKVNGMNLLFAGSRYKKVHIFCLDALASIIKTTDWHIMHPIFSTAKILGNVDHQIAVSPITNRVVIAWEGYISVWKLEMTRKNSASSNPSSTNISMTLLEDFDKNNYHTEMMHFLPDGRLVTNSTFMEPGGFACIW